MRSRMSASLRPRCRMRHEAEKPPALQPAASCVIGLFLPQSPESARLGLELLLALDAHAAHVGSAGTVAGDAGALPGGRKHDVRLVAVLDAPRGGQVDPDQ